MKGLTWLAFLLPADDREVLLGDIEEAHARDVFRMGHRRAAVRAVRDFAAVAVRSRFQSHDPGRYRLQFEETKRHHMDAWTRDIKYGFRTLGRTPGFTFVVILMLALGIGSNTAIFSLLDQMLYRPLPVHDAGALVQLDDRGAFMGRTMNRQTFSYPMYRDLRDQRDVFAGTLGRFSTAATVVIDGQSERVQAEVVTGNFFEVLGIQPAAGRLFSGADEQRPGAHPVAVLSHGYWQRRFSEDQAVVGRSISVNGHPMTVVGISPKGFHGVVATSSFDIAVPVMMKAVMTPTWNDLDNRRSRWLTIMARLAPGVSIEEARARMAVVYRQINQRELAEIEGGSESFRKRFAEKTLEIMPGGRGFSFNTAIATPLLTMMAMVGLVLLIACANIANLILARSAARRRETAVRLALGAGRGTLARQQIAESLLLSLAGGLAGLGVSIISARGILSALPAGDGVNSISALPDGRVLLFALAISVLTAVLFGLGPAFTAGRGAVVTALKDDGGAVMSGRGQMRVRKGLVVAQVALSMLLVAAGGLFARSLHNLRQFDPGFASDGLITFSVEPSLNGYSQPRIQEMLNQIRARAEGLPGVRHASMALVPLMTDNQWLSTIRVAGYVAAEGENMNPEVNSVGPGFFQSLGIPVIDGREFDERDRDGARLAAVVNETFARYFFKDERAVGQRFTMGRDAREIEIVGVVRDTKTTGVRDETFRVVFVPIAQSEGVDGATFYLRTASAAATPGAAIRGVVREIDPALPVFNLQTMEARMSESMFADRLLATLATAFAVLATLLAAVGLYGVMSYAVARRRKEIGVRMALGADAGSVQRMVLSEIALMAGMGIIIGLAAALGLGQLVKTTLFGTSPLDPIALTGAVLLLSGVILVAGWMPARSASRIEPLRALRTD